jgi:mRNA-degrading endonuclease RelE of RelBE toxin-antitoxin system
MSGQFDVRTTPRFERLLKKLARQHPYEAEEIFAEAITILKTDPYNRSRRFPIKKLESVPPGEGQYRLRLRRWRFRYDIWSDRKQVELSFCGLRREDTY